MDIYEEAVLKYISEKHTRFVNPQYALKWDKTEEIGGSLPDYVVLDIEEQYVYIVEVSKASNIDALCKKVKDKNKNWIQPIKKLFPEPYCNWSFHVTIFIREENVDKTNLLFQENDVSVISLKQVNNFLGNLDYDSTCPLKL